MKDRHGIEFTGTIQSFRRSMGDPIAAVKDQEDNCFEFEEHELELCLDC